MRENQLLYDIRFFHRDVFWRVWFVLTCRVGFFFGVADLWRHSWTVLWSQGAFQSWWRLSSNQLFVSRGLCWQGILFSGDILVITCIEGIFPFLILNIKTIPSFYFWFLFTLQLELTKGYGSKLFSHSCFQRDFLWFWVVVQTLFLLFFESHAVFLERVTISLTCSSRNFCLLERWSFNSMRLL
jgi:hypothetical protein